MRTAHVSDVGRRRPRNEDALLSEPSRRLFVVADGLGGHPAGDIASQLTVDLIADELLHSNGEPDLMQALGRVLEDANELVVAEGSEDPEKQGMGTTAVIAQLSADERLLTIAHIGDSRAYVLRNGQLKRITEDHVLDGAFGRTLTQAIGASDGVQPECAEVELAAGDRILLCTDGLTDMLDDAEIGAVLAAGCAPKECCDRLVELALERGGHDNITMIVVDPQPAT